MNFELTPIEMLGMVGGFCSAVATLPQSIRIIKLGEAQAVSLFTLLILMSSYVTWLAYGIIQESISITFWNIIATILGGLTLYLKLKSSPKRSS